MKPGFFTMPLHPPGANMTETLKSDLDQIVKLDELGYAEAWIGEHFTAAWENIPSPELFIAQALGVTKNIRLGTGVTCMPNHDPFVLAHRIAQLDHMSEGRLNWGIGTGSFPGDTQVFGYDEDGGVDAGAYTRESLQTILKIWDNPEPGLYESKWWKFRIPERRDDIGLGAHVTPFQKPHPPIGVAGVSPNSPTLRMAGQFGWIPMSINLAPPVQIKTHWDSIEEGTLARDFERYFLPMLAHDGRLGIFKTDPDMPDSDVRIDYLMDNVFIVGSADEVTQKLNDLNGELDGFGTLLAMGHEWNPYDAWYESMSVLVKEVLPKVD